MKWFLREGLLATSVAALIVTLQPSWLPAVSQLWLMVVIVLSVSMYISWLVGIPPTRIIRPDLAPRPGNLTAMRDIEVANDFLIAVDYQLSPFLQRTVREIARDRLLTRRDIALEQEPMRAREVLGEQAWRLISPAQTQEPSSWSSLDHEQLTLVIAALEKV